MTFGCKLSIGIALFCVLFGLAIFLAPEPPQVDFQPQIQKLEIEKQEAHKEAAKAQQTAQELETALDVKASDLAKARARMQAALKAEREAKEAAAIQPEPVPDLPPWATNKLEAQANLITTLESNLQEHIERGDAWKKSSERWKVAFEQSEKQNECLKIAHQAQLSAVKSSRWKGRLEGFAVGLGTGFIGAKLK